MARTASHAGAVATVRAESANAAAAARSSACCERLVGAAGAMTAEARQRTGQERGEGVKTMSCAPIDQG
eukprot:6208916-Pleurochrysis_carterae.AAC.7